jgi:hypothetical protein
VTADHRDDAPTALMRVEDGGYDCPEIAGGEDIGQRIEE